MKSEEIVSSNTEEPLIEGRDYMLDERGRFVLTRNYLVRCGTCCKNGCVNCPYGFRQPEKDEN